MLLPFWKALVPDLRFVICLRNPLDVAQSLSKRDGMSIERGVYLWGLYTEKAIRDTNRCPRVFTFYEDFFADPVVEIKRLVEFCGLRAPDELSDISDMVSRELKHHASEVGNLLNEDNIPAEYAFFYMCLRSLSIEARSKELADGQSRVILSENIAKLLDVLERFRDQNEAAHAYSELAYTRSLLNENTRLVVSLRSMFDKSERDLSESKIRLDQLHGIVDSHEKTLEAIYSSQSWMLIQRVRSIVNRMIPPGTRVRRAIVSSLTLMNRKKSS